MATSIIALLAVAGHACAAPLRIEPTAAEADALCARYADADPPLADQPTPVQRDALDNCDSEALLYGIGRRADPRRARLCAFAEADMPPSGPSQLFSGNAILMTIYANGLGVPRNRPVAMKLACELDAAVMARNYRVAHLAGTMHQPWYKPVFSPCDDATSGFEGGECAAHDARFHDTAFRAALDADASALPAAARPAFAALRRAQASWAEKRSDGEIDQTGTLRDAFVIAEQQLQNDDFAAMLQRLRRCRPPKLGDAERDAAQSRIDKALRSLLSRPDSIGVGDITPDGIRTAQAAWTAYRDAWGHFVNVAYRAWNAAGAEAWVTIKRADMLEHLQAQSR